MAASPSASSRSRTLAPALSVTVMTGSSCWIVITPPRLAGRERNLARRAIDESAELVDADAADGVDEAFDEAAVEIAHELRVGLGQLGERAAGERDDDLVGVVGHCRVEADAAELVDQGGDAHRSAVVGVVELGDDRSGLDRGGRGASLLATDLDRLVSS